MSRAGPPAAALGFVLDRAGRGLARLPARLAEGLPDGLEVPERDRAGQDLAGAPGAAVRRSFL